MYDPKGNSKDKAVQAVVFEEAEPPPHLSGIVHRFIHLRTDGTLAEPYRFHALPDACTYIVFDQNDPEVTGVSKLRAVSEEFDLGRAFHFVNVRLLPGVWQGPPDQVTKGVVTQAYGGDLPLVAVNQALQGGDFAAQQGILVAYIEGLVARGLVLANPVTEAIFRQVDDIFSVADMAQAAGLSARQLQRVLKQTSGYTPHDFLKILRIQQILSGSDTSSYADQSHFIHSFRKATGYTPGKYAKKYDV